MSLYPCLHLVQDLQHSFSFKEGTPQNTCKTTLGFNVFVTITMHKFLKKNSKDVQRKKIFVEWKYVRRPQIIEGNQAFEKHNTAVQCVEKGFRYMNIIDKVKENRSGFR